MFAFFKTHIPHVHVANFAPQLRSATLPVSRPLARLRSRSDRTYRHRELGAVGLTVAVLTPRHFSGVGVQVAARNVVVCANFGATQAAKEAFGLVGAGTVL